MAALLQEMIFLEENIKKVFSHNPPGINTSINDLVVCGH